MNISLKRRLVRLERRFGVEASQARYPEYIAEQWLTIFQEEEAKGVYVDERDFPLALASFRQAIEDAGHESPPFFPPEDFRTDLALVERIVEWRRPRFYRKVRSALTWLFEFSHRVYNHIPPVTTQEFEELRRWVEANDSKLRQAYDRSGLLPLGDGRTVNFMNILAGLQWGPRESGAGELAQTIREIKGFYGDEENLKANCGDALT
jgi:hypothetical protein